jgi:hypothetical protein
MRVSSYSKVDAVEQRDMVKSGVRGTRKKDRNLRTTADCTLSVPIIYPTCTIFKYLVLAPEIYSTVLALQAPGDAVASGSSLVLPRAAVAVGTRGQCVYIYIYIYIYTYIYV